MLNICCCQRLLTLDFEHCGAKEFDNLGPLYTKLKAHAEEEEMAEDEQRKPK